MSTLNWSTTNWPSTTTGDWNSYHPPAYTWPYDYHQLKRNPREEACPHCGRCHVCGRKDEEPKDNTATITWGYVGAPWIE